SATNTSPNGINHIRSRDRSARPAEALDCRVARSLRACPGGNSLWLKDFRVMSLAAPLRVCSTLGTSTPVGSGGQRRSGKRLVAGVPLLRPTCVAAQQRRASSPHDPACVNCLNGTVLLDQVRDLDQFAVV